MAHTNAYPTVEAVTHNQTPANWYSIVEAARYIGVGPRLVRRLVKEGALPTYRLHGAAHIPGSAIDRWLYERAGGPLRDTGAMRGPEAP